MATALGRPGGGEEAGAKAARLRTETFYKAEGAGEWAQHHEAVPSLIPLVKGEIVQRKIMFLSGEPLQASRPAHSPAAEAGGP